VLADDKLARLLNSALACDAVMALGLRREADLMPDERKRGERWRRDQPRPADRTRR
jgi:hypothetical protein